MNKLQPYIEENELVHNDPDRMDGGPVTDWKCPLCGADLSSLKEFTVHLRSHNEVKPTPDPSDPTGEAKVYYCCLCGKMLSSFSSLDRHMLVHSGDDNRSTSPHHNPVSQNQMMTPMAPRSQPVDALTRPQPQKDKDLADVESILSIAQNFSGIPQEQNTSKNCIEERINQSIDSIASEETEDNSSSAICDQSNDGIITSLVEKLEMISN